MLEGEQPQRAKPAPVELLGPATHAGQPVQLCRVGKNTVGVSAAPQPLGLTLADGVVVGPTEAVSRRVPVQVFSDQPEYDRRLLIAGCDPAISLLSQSLVRAEGVEMVMAPCSSHQALQWLKEGKVHIAGSHLKDDHSGEYNMPFIKRLFPNGGVQVVTFAIWDEGLVITRGNPKQIRNVEDLARKNVSIINREQGAGSRQLLDKKLAAAGIEPQRVRGYDRIAGGHLPAALSVNAGEADCCVATRAAAQAFGLDFIPMATERYDLVFLRRYRNLAAVQSMLDVLNRSALRRKLEMLAGYDTSHTGEILSD